MQKKLFFKILSGILMGGLWISTQAATVNEVKDELRKKFPDMTPLMGVKKTPFKDVFEVNMMGKLSYTNASADYLIMGGKLLDTKNTQNLTDSAKALKEIFNLFPKEQALKVVYGKGERKIIAFEDPDCEMCKAQHQAWTKESEKVNATVYTYLYPLSIHPDSLNKIKYIWCQKNPEEVFKKWMVNGQGIPLNSKGNVNEVSDCKKPEINLGLRLAKDLNYHETPRLIFQNGQGSDHALKVNELEDILIFIEQGG